MNSPRRQRSAVAGVLAAAILMGCVGCQTFSLSEEDFRKQQRGEMVDKKVGDAVGAAGTVGYYGTMLGLAIANVLH